MDKKPKMGDILIINSKNGSWLSEAIRDVSESRFTHTAIIVGEWFGKTQTYGAELLMTIRPAEDFMNEPNDYELWRPTNVPPEGIYSCVQNLIKNTGKPYGILTLPWFLWGWTLKNVFGKSRIGKKNWFPGNICSEQGFKLLREYAGYDPKMMDMIKDYNGSTTAPGDLSNMFYKNVRDGINCIELVDYRIDPNFKW